MPKMNLDTLEGIIQEVSEIYSSTNRRLDSWLHKEILLNALKFKRDEVETLDLKIINRAMAEFRYAARVFRPYRKTRKVSIFGSARTPENDPYYELAVQFSRMLVSQEFMVITGAASGIMKAGNVGAGADKSFGANILLPFEQGANEIIVDDPKLITFRYFFIRKLFFLMEADAIALFPGGFGTHDESFETLTLLQTGKAPPMPFILMELPGEDYWESWDHFIRSQLLRRNLISDSDLSLYKIVNSPEEGVEWILSFYSTYHSIRRVREKLVVRLENELTDEHIEKLNESFADLITSGKIEKTQPLPPESNEPELLHKPRIVFAHSDRHSSRLVEMILEINKMGQSLAVATGNS